MELSVYQIDLSSRKTIQGQALADFIVEGTLLDSSNNNKSSNTHDIASTWTLNIDGLIEEKHKGTGFIVEDPDGH